MKNKKKKESYNLVKHLELIQKPIERMASNSFLIKGWSITIVSALFILAERDANIRFSSFALFPAVVFWGLDAYFLRQEKLFRALYEDACNKNTKIASYSLDVSKYRSDVEKWICLFFNNTIFLFHFVIVLVVIAMIITSK